MSGEDDGPVRDHMDSKDITWRHGSKPDYTLINKLYMAERTKKHKPGSLEKIAENLVKSWEMEASHKIESKDWKTVNPDKYCISANEGRKFQMNEIIQMGTYNMLMNDAPLYDAENMTFAKSHDVFKAAFPNGFAWELLEILAGPPKVTFTWRHWAHWEGDYGPHKATNEVIELFGAAVATVDDKLRIEEIKVYYDPNPFLAKLSGLGPGMSVPMKPKAAAASNISKPMDGRSVLCSIQ